MKFSTRSLARAALIAALYALLTFFLSAISFGAIQFRAAEALTLLPILTVDAIPGLFLGCLLANLLGGEHDYITPGKCLIYKAHDVPLDTVAAIPLTAFTGKASPDLHCRL